MGRLRSLFTRVFRARKCVTEKKPPCAQRPKNATHYVVLWLLGRHGFCVTQHNFFLVSLLVLYFPEIPWGSKRFREYQHSQSTCCCEHTQDGNDDDWTCANSK